MQEKEGKGRETGRNRELQTEEERGNHVEEPSCDSCPTSMHRCECYECALESPATLLHFRQIIRFYTDFYKSHPIYTAFYTAFSHMTELYPCYISDCLKSPLVKIFFGYFLFFFFTPGSDSSNKTADNYCTLTERRTDRHKYTEQVQRDRKRRRKAENQKQIERHACRQVTVTFG